MSFDSKWIDRVYKLDFATFAISFTISKASSKFPSIETISAPYITACDNLPNAILPSGITTIAFKPALAAYAAADADVFPVEAHITIFLPCSLLLSQPLPYRDL